MFASSLRSTTKIVLLASLVVMGQISLAQQQATVSGTATANLRAGPGVEHALKAVLKEGDRVDVQQLTGDWYLVNAADGQKGYVHRNLLKMAAAEPAPPAVTAPQAAAAKSTPSETKEPSKEPEPAAVVPTPQTVPVAPIKPAPAPPAPRRAEPLQHTEAKSQSVLQMVEGHEAEIKIGLIIAAIFFAIGWLCGGAYYDRRERRSRHKLRF